MEEKIEACKCLMWGFNVHRERKREVHLYSSGTDGLCWSDVWVPLLAGLPGPASACVPVHLAPPTTAWHRPNIGITVSESLETTSHTLHRSCCFYSVSKPIIKLNVMSFFHFFFFFLNCCHGAWAQRLCHVANHNMFTIEVFITWLWKWEALRQG